MGDVLYKKGISHLYLRCLGPDEANYVIREVHEYMYGNYSRAQSLVHKLIRAGYYWPTMQKTPKPTSGPVTNAKDLAISLDNQLKS